MSIPIGSEIENVIRLLASLPGLGPRSARRAVLHLIKKKENLLLPLTKAMKEMSEKVVECRICGNIDTQSPCSICQDNSRDSSLLVVVETVTDLWALERTGTKAFYHILGGVISIMNGTSPEDLSISQMIRRVQQTSPQEVILALNATVDGQTTAHYITDLLSRQTSVKISRLAHGIPFGGELDYLDEGTLKLALHQRVTF